MKNQSLLVTMIFAASILSVACEDVEDSFYDVATTPNALKCDDTAQAVTEFILVDADTSKDIRVLANNDIINLWVDGENLSIRAEVTGRVRSVIFSLDGDDEFKLENKPPFAIAGDKGYSHYRPWTPSMGPHALSATPYSRKYGEGTEGETLEINFQVVDEVVEDDDQNDSSTAVIIALHSGKLLTGNSYDRHGHHQGHHHGHHHGHHNNVYQWQDTASPAQEWKINDLGDDYFEIVNSVSGKCLDAAKKGKHHHSNVTERKCDGSENQQWELVSDEDGNVEIISKRKGKCLEVERARQHDGAKVVQRHCNGRDHQKWTIDYLDTEGN